MLSAIVFLVILQLLELHHFFHLLRKDNYTFFHYFEHLEWIGIIETLGRLEDIIGLISLVLPRNIKVEVCLFLDTFSMTRDKRTEYNTGTGQC